MDPRRRDPRLQARADPRADPRLQQRQPLPPQPPPPNPTYGFPPQPDSYNQYPVFQPVPTAENGSGSTIVTSSTPKLEEHSGPACQVVEVTPPSTSGYKPRPLFCVVCASNQVSRPYCFVCVNSPPLSDVTGAVSTESLYGRAQCIVVSVISS
jgi:RNA polymerase II subunit A C-terminal domain phosphatase SSU72